MEEGSLGSLARRRAAGLNAGAAPRGQAGERSGAGISIFWLPGSRDALLPPRET